VSKGDRFLVTGGTGFLGSALVRRLVQDGHRVRVLDNNWRGLASRLADVQHDVELIEGDIRDASAVSRACDGVTHVCHLASVNGTEHFYTQPDLVLDVGVRGMLNVIDACREKGVRTLLLASSSEVYQAPGKIPTDESVGMLIPDALNPRFSYAGAKLVSELMALHWAAKHVARVVVFRPHNVYGPDMGTEHVIPQFALRMSDLIRKLPRGPINFPIEGTGTETRAFVHIDDAIDGLMCLVERGAHKNIYHLGNDVETDMATLARQVARCFDREIYVVPGALKPGGTARRCPDISKLRALGFAPRVALTGGLQQTVRWYRDNLDGRGGARRVA
jgi:dTDP-glucose 4,6-dehydratase/UDP-glucose 4-epimerase